MDFILKSKRNELTSKLMLSGSDGLSKYDLHKMDPETQARLGALFEAAGKTPYTCSLKIELTIYVLEFPGSKLSSSGFTKARINFIKIFFCNCNLCFSNTTTTTTIYL